MKLIEILTNQQFLGAVFSTLAVILLSFLLRRKNIIKESAKHVISGLVLKIGLPAMAFTAFMTDLNAAEFKSNIQVLILGIILYLFLIIISFLLFKYGFKKMDKDKRDVIQMIIIFGNCTFFSLPIIEGYYGNVIMIPASLMIIAFRLFLYTYAFFVMSGAKVDKHNVKQNAKVFLLNPIVVATVLGLLIWSMQNISPKVDIDGNLYSIFRIDKTLPFVYKPLEYLSKIGTPLSWILVGITIGEMPFKQAFKNVGVWLVSFVRTILVPLIILVIVLSLQYFSIIHLTKYGFAACILTLAAPLSVVINSYAVEYDKCQYYVSDVSLISTLIGMITLPLLLVVVELISTTSLF